MCAATRDFGNECISVFREATKLLSRRTAGTQWILVSSKDIAENLWGFYSKKCFHFFYSRHKNCDNVIKFSGTNINEICMRTVEGEDVKPYKYGTRGVMWCLHCAVLDRFFWPNNIRLSLIASPNSVVRRIIAESLEVSVNIGLTYKDMSPNCQL